MAPCKKYKYKSATKSILKRRKSSGKNTKSKPKPFRIRFKNIKKVKNSKKKLKSKDTSRRSKSFTDWVTELVFRYLGRVANIYYCYYPPLKETPLLLKRGSKLRKSTSSSSTSLRNSRSSGRLRSKSEQPDNLQVSAMKSHPSNTCLPSSSTAPDGYIPASSRSLEEMRSFLNKGFEDGKIQAVNMVKAALNYGIRTGVVEQTHESGVYRLIPHYSEDNIASSRRVRFQTPSVQSIDSKNGSEDIKNDQNDDRWRERSSGRMSDREFEKRPESPESVGQKEKRKRQRKSATDIQSKRTRRSRSRPAVSRTRKPRTLSKRGKKSKTRNLRSKSRLSRGRAISGKRKNKPRTLRVDGQSRSKSGKRERSRSTSKQYKTRASKSNLKS